MGSLMPGRAVMVTLALCLCACAAGPNFKRPAAPSETSYGAAETASTTASAGNLEAGDPPQHLANGMDIPAEWWTLFKSPNLDALVSAALRANPDVGAAQAALRQTHELYKAQIGSFLPTVQAGLSAARSKDPTSTLTSPTTAPSSIYSLYTAQLQLSYAPDVFGGTRRAVEAAKAQAEQSRFQLEATYLTLTSNVVVTAIQEASLRGQIEATLRLTEIEHQLTATLQQQRTLGTASELDVLAQQAAEAQTAATLPPLQKQLGQTRDALTALLGRLPAQEPAQTFRFEEISLPAQLPVSIPAKLIEQRPDVRQAEEALHAASAADGVALANMLPQFAITGDLGSSALALRQLFTPYTGFWDIGASLSQVLFQGGTLMHRHRAADAALDEAGAQYRGAVILACQNVADTLRALKADADASRASAASEQAAQKTFELARQQRELGTISTVAMLNAEQNLLQVRLAVVQAQANRYADTAGLFQALGGGWWNRIGEPRYEQFDPAGR
jgi:NodT family efflux transporter outer membrane factor (OMF) lipoprotein